MGSFVCLCSSCFFKGRRGLVGLCFPVYGSFLYIVAVLVVQLGSCLSAYGETQVVNTAAPAIRI